MALVKTAPLSPPNQSDSFPVIIILNLNPPLQ